MFNRRQFVITTGIGVLAGGFGVAQLLGAKHTATASASSATPRAVTATVGANTAPGQSGMAGMPDMAALSGPSTISSFTYRGHSVELTETADAGLLAIDGHPPIHLERPETGKIHTHLLPFNLYDDPKILVRDVLEASRLGMFVI